VVEGLSYEITGRLEIGGKITSLLVVERKILEHL
jgi:hypothetical protein